MESQGETMIKRLIDANASDFARMNARELVESIRLSEGRVVVAEVVAIAPPLIDKASNAELAAAMGADMVILNLYDVQSPQVSGFPDQGEGVRAAAFGRLSWGHGMTVGQVKEWIGRPVGLNLEPIENPAAVTTHGRLATVANAQAAVEQGADLIVITGNPYTGVTTRGIARAVAEIRKGLEDEVVLLAGKAHAAGTRGPVITGPDIDAFADSGADGIVLPVPGTVPGMTVEAVRGLVEAAHDQSLLVLNVVATSQEGASATTIEQLALMSKMTGADMHHLGDAGTMGIAVPENITAWSIALRGRRHTWHRMAASVYR
jgi:hypothetical protein